MPLLDPFIPIHLTLARHPKTVKLASLLGVERSLAVGCLVTLWTWCAQYVTDGDLSRLTMEEIDAAAGWPHLRAGHRSNEPGALLHAMVHAKGPSGHGFVDLVNGRYLLHDWDDYQGHLADIRTRNREAQRRRRARLTRVTSTADDRAMTSSDSHMTSSDLLPRQSDVSLPQIRHSDSDDGHHHDRTGPDRIMTGHDKSDTNGDTRSGESGGVSTAQERPDFLSNDQKGNGEETGGSTHRLLVVDPRQDDAAITATRLNRAFAERDDEFARRHELGRQLSPHGMIQQSDPAVAYKALETIRAKLGPKPKPPEENP